MVAWFNRYSVRKRQRTGAIQDAIARGKVEGGLSGPAARSLRLLTLIYAFLRFAGAGAQIGRRSRRLFYFGIGVCGFVGFVGFSNGFWERDFRGKMRKSAVSSVLGGFYWGGEKRTAGVLAHVSSDQLALARVGSRWLGYWGTRRRVGVSAYRRWRSCFSASVGKDIGEDLQGYLQGYPGEVQGYASLGKDMQAYARLF